MTFLCEYHVWTVSEEFEDIEDDINNLEGNDIDGNFVGEIDDLRTELNSESKKDTSNVIQNHMSIINEVEPDIIKVITQNKSTILTHQKNVPEKEEKNQSDDTTWSIFQFIKNMIKLPFLILSNQ